MTINTTSMRQIVVVNIVGAILMMFWLQFANSNSVSAYHWAPFIVGLVVGLGLSVRRTNPSARDIIRAWAVSAGIFFGLLILFEILKYQPGQTLTADNGVRYSLYQYRSIYGSLFVIFFSLILLAGIVTPLLFPKNFWRNFHTRGKMSVVS